MTTPAALDATTSPAVTRGDWQRAFELLDIALELPAASQTEWLATLSPEQAHLTPLVAQLLQAHAAGQTDDFLESPPSFDLAPPPPVLGPVAGTLVGPYRLLREIGQGGMASVWLAERADGLLERQVALKLPHMSWGAASFAERMARERNILASLAHPNIARLYDAGLAADGRPFLALEYVDGLPIDAYARERQLGVHERVGLIVQVARAVAHAHAHLVVHRDLKPSNILVDAEGQAHLLDFGIAKLVDPLHTDAATGQLTQQHGRALTPEYASPEQIRGDVIGTASDVYSLGVVLYELLVGTRPYKLKDGLAAMALAEAIAQADPPRASSAATDEAVRRQLKGDLDAILVRAMGKAVHERYPSVAAFADDLERHLRGEPVQARPDSRWYRSERWVRRHKLETAIAAAIVIAVPAGAAAQAAVMVAIAAGAGIALWQARVARRQTQVAKEEAARAAAVKGFLTSFFKSGSLDEDAGAQLGRLSVQQFVERGARKIDAGFEHEPALKSELFDVVSTLFADLSDGAATANYARKWLHTQEQSGATESERARASQRLAKGLALLGREAEAAGVLRQATARLRGSAGAAGSASVQAVHLLVDQARILGTLGDRAQALEGVDEALALLATQAGDLAATADVQAAALFLRADLVAGDNRLDEALPLFEDAIARLARLHGERSAVVGRHRFLLALALGGGRRHAQAAQELRRALQLFREAGGAGELNAAIVELELGRLLAWTGQARAEGLTLVEHARDVFEARADSVSPLYPAQANLYLAESLLDDGDFARAQAPMEAAVALYRDKVEDVDARTVATLIHARYLAETGDYDASDRLLEAARAERARVMGPDHPDTAVVTNRIGLNQLRRRDFAAATAIFESVIGAQDQGEAVWGSAKHMAHHNLAVVYLESGDLARALPLLQHNLDHYLAMPESERNLMSEAALSLNLGRALLGDGQPQRALPLLQRNVDIAAESFPRAPGLATSRSWLGLCLLQLGDMAKARELAAQARATLEAQPNAGPHYRRGLALLEEQLAALS